MDTSTTAKLRVGAWWVDPALGEMGRDGDTVRLDPRTLRLLLCLAARAGEIVSADELLSQVWPGVIVTPDSVYQAIASLRRQLGDDPKQAIYIATVPRQGYKMVAAVGPWSDPVAAPSPPVKDASPLSPQRRLALLASVCLPIVAAIGFWMYNTQGMADARASVAAQPIAIAVLPFRDLTEGMESEIFADGMTEELIDRLSKVPGLKVPEPTATFIYKGKHTALKEIADKLGVVYILGGSVRKSGTTMRVSARLIKADNGFIIWAETYDRPVNDLLMVQVSIADTVSKTLKAKIANIDAITSSR
jgi:transcriptional activator of cad operon